MKTLQLLFFFALLFNVTQTFSQDDVLEKLTKERPLKIGDEFEVNISTAHPYKSLAAGAVFEREFHSKDASYIKLYFEDFNLAPGDYVEVYNPETDEQFIYAGQGKLIDENYTMVSDFWSNAIFADKVIVKLHTVQASQGFGFNIKKVAYGYTNKKLASLGDNYKIIDRDDKERIACYKDTEMFNKGMAVSKLIIGGTGSCTAWMLGCEGNVMTNNHCIGDAGAARDVEFIFNYRKENCTGSTNARTESVTRCTFIKTSSSLDYTLVKLPGEMHKKYGYLSLSSKAAQVGDRIYIPQHPGGRLKEIAVKSDKDSGPYGTIQSSNSSGITYYADTEGGSSGSPVISYDKHLVYAIHNKGTTSHNLSDGRSPELIKSIGNDMPKCGVDDPNSGDIPPTADFLASTNCSTVSFSNTSVNGKTYKWDFGDGKTSTDKDPTHTYDKSGEYTVTLTAVNDSGDNKKTLKVNVTKIDAPRDMVIGVCKGEPAKVELESTDGDYIWYDSATNGKILGTGNSYDAGSLNANKTFYVSKTSDKVTRGNIGIKTINQSQGDINNAGLALIFNAKKNFILNSIKVYAESAGKRTLEIKNSKGGVLKTLEVNMPSGESRVELNLNIEKGEDLQLTFNEDCGLFRTKGSGNLGYPFTLAGGDVSITKSTASKPTEFYYYAYDWEVTVIGDCETERGKVEVQPATKPSKPAVSVDKKDGTATLKTKDTYKFYQWYLNDKAIEGATKQSYSTKKEGKYHVEVSNVKGCDAVSDKVVVDNLSNNEFALPKGVAMYPNPTKGILNLTGLDKIGKNNSFKLINMLGQQVKTFESNKINEKLDVSSLSKGMYFLSINNTYMVKFVKN